MPLSRDAAWKCNDQQSRTNSTGPDRCRLRAGVTVGVIVIKHPFVFVLLFILSCSSSIFTSSSAIPLPSSLLRRRYHRHLHGTHNQSKDEVHNSPVPLRHPRSRAFRGAAQCSTSWASPKFTETEGIREIVFVLST